MGAIERTERIGGTSTCCIPFFACKDALIFAAAAASRRLASVVWESCTSNLPAAAAGSPPGAFLFSSDLGLKADSLATGLRLRLDSECRLDGERDRRSKREDRLTSGSVWSKRERLVVRRSSSVMVNVENVRRQNVIFTRCWKVARNNKSLVQLGSL